MILLESLTLLHLYASATMASGPWDIPSSIQEISDGSQVYIYTTDYRSTAQIVISCLSTMLLCTWFTIHLNIRGDNEPTHHLQRKLGMFLWALLTPEAVMGFACNQWFGARAILTIDRFQGRGWSKTEAHFIQMGGISFNYPGKNRDMGLEDILRPAAAGPMDLGVPEALEKLENLHTSVISRNEIIDRGKRDALAKAIVLIQTSWFIVQCVARAVHGLAVTQLEIVTLAYTALNGVMFFFWWDKPLDVHWSVVVHLNLESGSGVPPSDLGSEREDAGSITGQNGRLTPPPTAPLSLFGKMLNNWRIGLSSPP